MFDKRQIKTTADGSKTIFLPDYDEHYHSIHGAVQESRHVFLKHGLNNFQNRSIHVLEIGFGTGLNALLTAFEAQKLNLTIDYTGIEAYPVAWQQIVALDYCRLIDDDHCATIISQMHQTTWEKPVKILDDFTLTKKKMLFQDLKEKNTYDLIYYDAFGARVQPELWTETLFQIMRDALKKDGILTTYSAKGSARRAMQSVGFMVEKLPGPPGKREMLRGRKDI